MARQWLLAVAVATVLVASALLVAVRLGMAPAASQPAAIGPIVVVPTAEARQTDPHDLSTFDRQLQPGMVIGDLTVVTR